MGLPTPPSTAHRNKEIHFGSTASRVVWSTDMVQLRRITGSPPPQCISVASASKNPPTKSILKPPRDVLPFPEECPRETTPQPSDPLSNLTYLDYPVSRIIASNASLRDLIEAYSVLAARIRSSVTTSTDADVSWPLFQPLKKHRAAIVDALVRDLGRALVDPGSAGTAPDQLREQEALSLPSPKSSPKRKQGMTAEQVKFARDLCTTSHSVMKLLAVVFTMPVVYQVFTDAQLSAILTEVLAIPLAPELPTPNARKTYALSIWLLQAQRLPSEILLPAVDRIAYALRRGIEGELGKEGKKGSASDGLKAIHDLAIYQPFTFVVAFTDLLPPILSNLLAPTLTLRTQACHALGGFVIGCTSLPVSHTHTRISNMITEFLTAPPTPSTPTHKTTTSLTAPSQNDIIRTLRTTLIATEPQVAAQGPVWALSVLASFVVLLGPVMYLDVKVTRIISALLSCSMNHKKSAVRALGCLVWRTVTWAYFQPPLPAEDEEDDQMDIDQEIVNTGRANYWKVVKSVVDLGAGTATIAGLLGNEITEEDDLKQTMSLLKIMISKGGQTCGDAMDIVKHFVSCDSPPSEPWDLNKLLPLSLFSASPGLLTVEYKSLVGVVKPIFNQCPQLNDIRPLTHEEVANPWVFEELVKIWREGIEQLEIAEDFEAPTEITGIWDGLLRANVAVLEDARDNDGISQFAIRAIKILVDILHDENLNLTTKSSTEQTVFDNQGATKQCVPETRSNAALKLSLVRELWSVMRSAITNSLVCLAGETFLEWLMKNENNLVWESGAEDDVRRQWASLCADILVVCDADEMGAFWGRKVGVDGKKKEWAWTQDIRSLVWKSFVEVWREDKDRTIESCIVLLGVPFGDKTTWDLSNEDFEVWDCFLHLTTAKAQAFGIDSANVLDETADAISRYHTPAFISSIRVADLLLSHFDISDARQIPDSLFSFVNEVFVATYPPEPRNKVASIWIIRTLTRIVDGCSSDLGLDLLEAMQEGLSTWISDERNMFDQEEYTFDILPLYQTSLFTMRGFDMNYDILDRLSDLLGSPFCSRKPRSIDASEAFHSFWVAACSSLKEPPKGWPAQIQKCLTATSGKGANDVSDERTATEMITSHSTPVIEDVEGLQWPESEDDDEEASCSLTEAKGTSQQPPRSSLGDMRPIVVTSTSVPTAIYEETDQNPILSLLSVASQMSSSPRSTSTPRKALRGSAPAPPLPRKPSTTASIYPSASPLPLCHRSPVAPSPLPKPGLPCSPRPKNNSENKENVSPHTAIVSVTDRITMSSSGRTKMCPSKRQRSGIKVEGASKRQKTDSGFVVPPTASPGSDTSEDERVVETALVGGANNGSVKAIVDIFSEPLVESAGMVSQKRRRVFMEAVELPTLREFNRRSKEMRSAAASKDRAPTASGDYEESNRRSKKRRRDKLTSKHAADPFSSTTLQELTLVGSDDSIMSSAATAYLSEGSSDDDPHFGQVTPHHLISPVLRRVKSHKNDPPSDDSNMSDSPSREIAARRLRRLGSISNISGVPYSARR